MSSGLKYATKEEYLEVNKQKALEYYYEHRDERLEKDRKYQKERYRKKREEILAKKKQAYQESKNNTLSDCPISIDWSVPKHNSEIIPKIIVTPNFILEIVK